MGDFKRAKYVEGSHKLGHNEDHFVFELGRSRGAEAKSVADHLQCDGELVLVLFPVWQGANKQELLGGRVAAERAAWACVSSGRPKKKSLDILTYPKIS